MKMTSRASIATKRRPERAAARPVRESTETRARLRERLVIHLNELGYTVPAPAVVGPFEPELRRRNPYRGSVVYGATVTTADLGNPKQHERLVFFASRRTRKRATIQLYIAVAAKNRDRLDALLERLSVRTHARGGNVQLVLVED